MLSIKAADQLSSASRTKASKIFCSASFDYGHLPSSPFSLQVKFSDGVYSDDQIQSRLVEPAALGDLNGDCRTDAAVILTIDPSGSGTFY